MTLKDIRKYKNEVFKKITQNEDIAVLILGSNYDKKKDLDNLLMYNNVFPYLYVDDTQTSQTSYVCVEVDVPRTMYYTYKDMKIIIWCYCHKGIMKISDDSVNTKSDLLAEKVDNLLNSSSDFGLGGLRLQSNTYFIPGKEYYGRQLIYSCPEFNIDKKVR